MHLKVVLSLIATIAFAAAAADLPVERAQALAIKKNRQEATAILIKAIQESPSAKTRSRWLESLRHLSTMFFTDKGQKTFESAQAAMWDNPDLALTQFREALVSEDQNILILNSVARVQIAKQDCDGALLTLQDARKVNPWHIESALLEMRTYLCLQRLETLREKLKSPPLNGMSKWQEAYVQFIQARDLQLSQSAKRAFELAAKITEEQPDFPEPYWLMARSASELTKDPEPYLQKYVSLCRAVTAREKKKFALEPRLCANLKEAEDELAKQKTADL